MNKGIKTMLVLTVAVSIAVVLAGCIETAIKPAKIDKSVLDEQGWAQSPIGSYVEKIENKTTTYQFIYEDFMLLKEIVIPLFKGKEIVEVIPNSPAERAGLKPGMVITRYDNISVKDMNFTSFLEKKRPGEIVEVWIDNASVPINVTLSSGTNESQGYLGIGVTECFAPYTIKDIKPATGRLVVTTMSISSKLPIAPPSNVILNELESQLISLENQDYLRDIKLIDKITIEMNDGSKADARIYEGQFYYKNISSKMMLIVAAKSEVGSATTIEAIFPIEDIKIHNETLVHVNGTKEYDEVITLIKNIKYFEPNNLWAHDT